MVNERYLAHMHKKADNLFKLFQDTVYNGQGRTHGDLAKIMGEEASKHFYLTLTAYKFAGRNIQRLAENERAVMSTENHDVEQHQDLASEQTSYFMTNMHSGIDQLHQFVAIDLYQSAYWS
jgi:hypothetical protein